MRWFPLVLATAVAACADRPDPPPAAAEGPAQESRISFQAVDAGTGGALTDPRVRVRWLVRSPVTLDETDDRDVPATEPVHVSQAVSADSLVVEVRLAAPSYHTVDTVLSVPRGQEAGPYTVRMARRLDRPASRPASGSTGTAAPPRTDPVRTATAPAPSTSSDGIDRTALRAGDQFFEAGRWLDAVQSYRAMSAPSDPGSAYAGEYQDALVRQARAHQQLGEFAGALDALERAVALDHPHPGAHLRLANIQCAVGRTDQGRQTLERLRSRASAIPPAQRRAAGALANYQFGVCAFRDFGRAEGSLARIRVGNQAVQALQSFLDAADAMPRNNVEVREAAEDARAKIDEIRASLRRGG